MATGQGYLAHTRDSDQAKASLIEDARIFRDFDWAELCLLASFMTCRELRAGEVLFEEGDAGCYMAILTAGVVSVVKRGAGGGEIIVGDIHVRHVVGEQALIDGEPRSATVYAQTPVALMVLRKEAFERIVDSYPRLGAKLLAALARVMSARLRKTTGQLACDGRREFLMR